MRSSTFAQAAPDEGAAAMNRVFEQYLVPIAFSAEQLRLHMVYNDVDPASSPIWYDDNGAVIAAAMLALRERRGWIGGFGVAPEYRRKGYARALVDRLIVSARERGLEAVSLEVLSENGAAIAVYGKAGFAITRRLFCFETFVEAAQMPTSFKYADPDRFIDAAQSTRPAWQRENASLRNGAISTAVSDGNGSYALFRHNANVAQVFKLNADGSEGLTALTSAICAGETFSGVMLLNEPEESPLVLYARRAGWNEPFVQYEMRLTL